MKLTELMRHHFGALDTGYDVTNWDTYDFYYAFTNATHALLLFRLFCPELVEVDDSVLLEQSVDYANGPDNFRQARDKDGRAHAEHAFNLIEVDYLFAQNPDEETMNEPLSLAIAEAWRAWLRYKYPDREFVVTTADREETLHRPASNANPRGITAGTN